MPGIQYVFWIGVAGAAGAILRYLAQEGVMSVLGPRFPYGTLMVNVVGSFVIGVLFVMFWERAVANELIRLAVFVGLLGSFTTFSAFSLDTWIFVQHGAYGKAVGNVLSNVLLCLGATWFGVMAMRSVY